MPRFFSHSFVARWFGNRSPNSSAAVRPAAKPQLGLEHLEERVVPAVITVTTTTDNANAGDNQVTLREAILAANTDSTAGNSDFTGRVTGTFGDDMIVFDP